MNERPCALVTGASSGIGRCFAETLAGLGHDLVLVARSETALKELATALPVDVEVLAADLVDPDDCRRIEARAASNERPLELLVNNAGFGTTGRFWELPLADEDRELRLNVVALTRLCHAVLPPMVARGRGGIINVGSIAGFQPAPGNATYAATKSFVLSLSLALHEELRGTGVRVTCLAPGATRTDFQQRANYDTSGLMGLIWQEPQQVVDAALGALRRGDPLCVPGAHNKAAAAATHVVPRRLLARVAGLVNRQI